MRGLLIIFGALIILHGGAAMIACRETGLLCSQVVLPWLNPVFQRDLYPLFLIVVLTLFCSGANMYVQTDLRSVRRLVKRIGAGLVGLAALSLALGSWIAGVSVLLFALPLLDPALPGQHVRLAGFALVALALSALLGWWGLGIGWWGLGVCGPTLGLALASHRLRGVSLWSRPSETAASRVNVRTTHLEMWLDRLSNTMGGQVLAGRFAGAPLHALSFDDLIGLREECMEDSQSLNLIETYLDRRHPTWRDTMRRRPGPELVEPGRMSERLACEILGLEPDADADAIIRAHRALIRRVHPDQGGNNYMASLTNEARDLLLRKRHRKT